MSAKEIITLQLGHYANHVGAHWWNIQESFFEYGCKDEENQAEEINHDVLFREGITQSGDITFTPRLILAELKGGLGCLKSSGMLYDPDEDASDGGATWDGDTCIYRQPKTKKNKFLTDLETPQRDKTEHSNGHVNGNEKSESLSEYSHNLEKDVSVWSDYLRTYLHPKSMVIVNDYYHNSENDPFDLFSKGAELKHVFEEIEERIRFYAEECDHLQGFHVLTDSYNGFAGLTALLMPYLHDEFSAKRTLAFPVTPGEFQNDSLLKSSKNNLSNSLLLPSLLEHCSLVCPLFAQSDMHHVVYDMNLSYHTSAILASVLDTLALSYRLRTTAGISMDQFCGDMISQSKNLASASISMPFPTTTPHTYDLLESIFSKHTEKVKFTSLTLDALIESNGTAVDYYSKLITLRGIDFENSLKPDTLFSSPEDYMKYQMDVHFRGCHNSAYLRQSALKTIAPFPQFFDDRVTRFGRIIPPSSNCNGYDETQYHHTLSSISNGSHHQATNGHGLLNGHCASSKAVVESVPVMASLECSSNLANVFRVAASRLQLSSRKQSSLHIMERENLATEIELLHSLHDEYVSERKASSDSDEDY